MAGKGTLTIKIVGDDSNFRKTVQGVTGSVKKIGKAVALGTAAAAGGAVALGNEVLNTGAKLEAWRTKTSTVFEGSAGDIRKWADKNNETFGVTDDQLAGMAASFGDLLKPMGFTADQAASMSKDVVGLSGALSEWSGGQRSAAEVSDILAKAMLGEREGLKELGISIMEADVQARLAAKGQDKLTGAALQQAKAQATQELIFEKSTDAQKAYAEGGNEALRASNRIRAGLGELREQMADKLLPIALKVGDWVGQQLPKAAAAVQPVLQRIGEVFAEIGRLIAERVWPPLRDLALWIRDNQPILIGLATAIGVGLVAAFTGWAISAGAAAAATIAAAAPVLAIGAAIAALVAGLIWAYQNWDAFRNVVDTVANFLKDTVWPIIQDFAKLIVDAFTKLRDWALENWPKVQKVIEAVAKFLAEKVWPLVKDFIDKVVKGFGIVKGWVDDNWPKIQGAIKAVADFLVGTVWPQVETFVNRVVEGFTLVKNWISGRISDVTGFLGTFQTKMTETKNWIRDRIDDIVGFFTGLPGKIGSGVVGAFDGIWDAFRSAINKIIRGWNNLQLGPWSLPSVSVPGIGTIGGGQIGPWTTPNVPTLHTGGRFQSGTPGGQGLAVLRDGERVSTPTEPTGGGFPDPEDWGRRAADAYARRLQMLQRSA